MPAVEAAADKYGFIMIFPQTTNPASSSACWDVGSTKSLTHDGGGDTQAIAQMVKYEVSKRNANANRVYIMGASSGAMLTEAMCAVYPDVFKAGAEFSGVPAGCWSDGWSAASNWGGTCANGQDTMTAQAWGDLARKMYQGYTGSYPRMQLWHGTADATINYNNETEAIKQWTDLLGLSATPNSTDKTSVSGFTILKWQNSCGFTVLEAHEQQGGGHTTPIDANSVISFFGLDKSSDIDPGVTACGDAGTLGGAGGASGTGGGTGAGGMGGSKDGGPIGGGAGNKDASSGAGGTGSGGAVASGGSGGSGGGSGTGGASGSGGAYSSGVGSGTGGANGSGGVQGKGGSETVGAPGSGGVVGSGGSAAKGGTSGSGGSGGVSSNGGSSSGSSTGGTTSSGCSCVVGGTSGSGKGLVLLLLAAVGLVLRHRRKARV